VYTDVQSRIEAPRQNGRVTLPQRPKI